MSGSAPGVIAQQAAAMTRNFDVKDEIEVKDDLDNKPDPDAIIAKYGFVAEEIYRAAVKASANETEAVESGHFNFFNFVTISPEGVSSWVSKPEFNNTPQRFGNYAKSLIGLYDTFLPRSADLHEKLRVDILMSLSDYEFRVNFLTETENTAAGFAYFLSQALTNRRDSEIDLRRSYIYSRSRIEVDGARVVIVTRLPRASLDPLLAENAI